MARHMETPHHLKPRSKPLTATEQRELEAQHKHLKARQARYERMLARNGLYICTNCEKQAPGRIDGLCEECHRGDRSDTAASEAQYRNRQGLELKQAEQKEGIY